MLKNIYIMKCDNCGEETRSDYRKLNDIVDELRSHGCIVTPRQDRKTFCNADCQESYRAGRRKWPPRNNYNGTSTVKMFVSTHVKRTN